MLCLYGVVVSGGDTEQKKRAIFQVLIYQQIQVEAIKDSPSQCTVTTTVDIEMTFD